MARKINTLGNLLAAYKDMDAYVARGGKILDLPGLESLPRYVADHVRAELGPVRCRHLARFWGRLADALPDGGVLGDHITEKQIRAMWKEAQPQIVTSVLDVVLPNGKKIRDCTGREMGEIVERLKRIREACGDKPIAEATLSAEDRAFAWQMEAIEIQVDDVPEHGEAKA